jgi:phosphate transport system permease protein
MSTATITPKPSRPWLATPKQRLMSVRNVLLSVVSSYLIVFVTPLKGKLPLFILFFVSLMVFSFITQFKAKGKAAAEDSLLTVLSVFAMTLAVVPIVSIVGTVVARGYQGLRWSIFTQDMSQATVNDPIENGGILHAILGTTIMVSIALVISLPIAVLTALYLTEIKGKLSVPIRFLVQAMSGVPSIVAGLFILSSIVYPITQAYSGLMGAFALAILMIPTVARTAEEVLLLIPNDLREAGLALGATQWRTVAMVVVPAVKSGLITAVILGVARIIGETAPVLLVSGGGDGTNLNPLQGPMGSIPYYVWKSFLLGGTEESSHRTWAGLLILLIWVMLLFGVARLISARAGKR